MPNPSSTRIAYLHLCRTAAPRELDDALSTLRSLEQLDGELTDVENAFSNHFKLAKAVSPEVNSQLEAFKKARSGFKTAMKVLEQVNSILELYPNDKTAQRAVKDADVMVRRFQRHADAAHKIIQRVSKKEMPPALKKLSAAVARGIKRRLIDPKALQIIPWQVMGSAYVRSDHRNRRVEGVEYQVVYRITANNFPGHGGNQKEMILTESTLTDIGPFYGTSTYNAKPATARDAVARFLAELEGWSGMAGEAEATAGRAATAKAVARVLNSANRGHSDMRDAEISSDNRTIEGEHRSWELPKEGAYDMGEYDYRELVDKVLGEFEKKLHRALAPFKDQIKNIGLSAGEKSWVYTTVTLK